MKNFRSAIQFMTTFPAGRVGEFDPAGMVPWFPVVGLLLGGALALSDALLVRWWRLPTVAVLEVVLLAAMTGAFHLDGLGDTADGLFSHRSREKILEIIKDSRIGSMGVVAICSVMAVKWAGLSALEDHRTLMLILVPAYARSAILLAMRFLQYGRPAGGLGLPFFSRRLGLRRFWGVAVTLALSIGLGPRVVWLNLAFFLIAAAVIGYYSKRLGCITGDMLGALTEITEAALFLVAAVGGGR